jgi:predicted MFS family arabinose efflux permease
VRKVLLPAIVLFALSYACLGLVGGASGFFIFTLIALVSQTAHGPLLYMKAVGSWPSRIPGLTMSMTLSGISLGGIFVPPLAQALIQAFGWRDARLILAGCVMLIALPAAILWVREPACLVKAEQAMPVAQIHGLTMQEAVRSSIFWRMATIMIFAMMGVYGITGNIVELAKLHGVSSSIASYALSAASASAFIARIASGHALDRWNFPQVGAVWFICSLAGAVLLVLHISAWSIFASLIVIGLSMGAEMQLAAYYTRRYFGLRSYAQVFGVMVASFTIGSSAGAFLFGAIVDLTRSETLALVAATGTILVAIILVLSLPRYSFDAMHGTTEIA